MSFFPNRKAQRAVNGERRPDAEKLAVVKDVMYGDQTALVKVKKMTTGLANAFTSNSILMCHKRPRTAPRPREYKCVVFAGFPAQLLTVGEFVEVKKAQNEEIANKGVGCETKGGGSGEEGEGVENFRREQAG